MDVWQLAKLILRRWYVAAPVLLLTLLAVVAIGGNVDPEYRAQATLVMVGPTLTEDEDSLSNPYLALGGNLGTVAEVTSLAAGSPVNRERVAADGLYPDYEVGTSARTPIITVLVSGGDAERAVATVDAVVEIVADDLADRQDRAGVDPASQIDTEVLVSPGEPATDFAARTRIRLVILVLGGVLAAALVFAVEGYSRLRARSAPAPVARVAVRDLVRGRPASVQEPTSVHRSGSSVVEPAEEPIASGDAPPAAADVGDSHPHSVVEGHDPEPPAPRFLPLPGLERVSNRSASTEWIYTGSATAQGPWPSSETPTAPAEEQPTAEPGPDEREEALQEEGGDVPQPDPWLRRP